MAQSGLLRQALPEATPRPVILVVETDPDTQALYRNLFPAEGYTVEVYDDGAEALGRAICRPPDLIVTEARVRRIDGFALSQLLRSDPATSRVPIVMVTSATSHAERTRAMRAGVDTVISKPFDLDDLGVSLRSVLTAGHGARAATASSPSLVDPSELAEATDATQRRRSMSRRMQRQWTTTPPLTPPALRCPSCDAALVYERSHLGGVSERAVEQWDYFTCTRCGPFQYRHRTRKLKRAV